ncbi:hypothetical protein NEPTK9_000468 [Candidatus Neptunochlamydia vexilliferae]|uniref:Transposase n=1 Tax=Candidatus Neptunichlamydia vexilliferae TaxID=1651774 RepID=A0ABS0AXV3_9BACT|nr:hypothetical protein [Candidatus Neptunochlamydia vexilliferae]
MSLKKRLTAYILKLDSVEKFIARSSGIFSETCDFFASKIAPDYLHSAKKSQVSRKPPLNPLALNFSTEPSNIGSMMGR